MYLKKLGIVLSASVLSLTISVAVAADKSSSEVLSADDVDWGYLNPARGDKGPSAADLWGDRTKDTESGILLKFPEGFSSPPHIHNITYRGVVIKGELHNDDPKAANMWLPAGSFWTQPAGEAHITSANGEENIAYIEINSGPYLVQPVAKSFDAGERPVNVVESNLVWLEKSEAVVVGESNAEVTYLWGSPSAGDLYGSMLKIPADFKGTIKTDADTFRAIVISGTISYQHDKDNKDLKPGSYFGSKGDFEHSLSLKEGDESVLYIRSNGKYEISAE